jgi:hypothetical protein
MDPGTEIQLIETTIRKTNRCRTESRDEVQFRTGIHPDAVTTAPGCLAGRKACGAGCIGCVPAAQSSAGNESGHLRLSRTRSPLSCTMDGHPVTIEGKGNSGACPLSPTSSHGNLPLRGDSIPGKTFRCQRD